MFMVKFSETRLYKFFQLFKNISCLWLRAQEYLNSRNGMIFKNISCLWLRKVMLNVKNIKVVFKNISCLWLS